MEDAITIIIIRLDEQDKEIKTLKEQLNKITLESRKKRWEKFVRTKSV